MSLLQISATQDRAYVVTDSVGYFWGSYVVYHHHGKPQHNSKFTVIPALRAVLAVRGDLNAFSVVGRLIDGCGSFRASAATLKRMLPKIPQDVNYANRQAALIGWCEDSEAICIASFHSFNGYADEVLQCKPGQWNTIMDPVVQTPSWVDDPQQVNARAAEFRAWLLERRPPDSVECAIKYAKRSIADARSETPSIYYGGRLFVAELTRDAINIVQGGDVGVPPRRPNQHDVAYTRPQRAPELQWLLNHRGSVSEREQREDGWWDQMVAAGVLQSMIARPPQAGTSSIKADAATEAFADETGADSVTIPGTGGTNFKTCALRSWTNTAFPDGSAPLSRPVIVQFEAEVTGLHFSSGSTLAAPDDFVSASWVFKVNGTPIASDPFIDSSDDVSPPTATSKLTRTVAWQYALGVGDTAEVSVQVGGGTDPNAATISWARTRLRTTILKA